MHANAYGIECMEMCANARQCTAMQQKRNADVIECIGMCLNEFECTNYGMYKNVLLCYVNVLCKMYHNASKMQKMQPGKNHTHSGQKPHLSPLALGSDATTPADP